MRNNINDGVSKHSVVILCLSFKTSPRAKPYENELDLLGEPFLSLSRFSSLAKVQCLNFSSSKVRCRRSLGRLLGSLLVFYLVVLNNFKIRLLFQLVFYNALVIGSGHISIHSSWSLCFCPHGFCVLVCLLSFY